MVCLLLLSGWGFRFLPNVFMPQLNKQYFTIDMWLPEGANIEETSRRAEKMVNFVRQDESVRNVSSFVGQTPPRFYLANSAYGPQSNYAQFLVEAESPEKARALQERLRAVCLSCSLMQ